MKKTKITNLAKKGGVLDGDSHADLSGGIKAVITDKGNKPVLLEKDEVVINKKAAKSKKVKTRIGTNIEILNEINTETGGESLIHVNEHQSKIAAALTATANLFDEIEFFKANKVISSACTNRWFCTVEIYDGFNKMFSSPEKNKSDAMEDIFNQFKSWAKTKMK